MQAYSTDDGVFIRSMASRGHSGGLSSSTAAAAAVLDAAGFDVVLIETVGTGQSEVEVAATADTTVVVEAPEMGDEIQAIKAGLLEVADIIVVNKGDRPGAHRTAGQLHAMLAEAPRDVRPGRPAPKNPDVLVTTAATGDGVAELLVAIDRHRATARGSLGADARFKRAETQVWAVLVDRLHERVRALEGAVDDASGRGRDRSTTAHAGGGAAAGELLLAVAAHEMDPFEAADALLAMLTGGPGGTVDAGGTGSRTGHRQA
jgi:LAO/AO transport system kinase